MPLLAVRAACAENICCHPHPSPARRTGGAESETAKTVCGRPTLIPMVEVLPFTHQLAHRLAQAGLRGASWYWRIARFLQHPPPPGLVYLPNGMPLMNHPDDWTCRTAYEGTYEREILRLLGDLVHEGDLVIDVGANVGIISARAAGLVGSSGRVIAVEPSPRCVGALLEVTGGLGNVTVITAALGDSDGMVELTGWDNPDHRGLGSVVPGHRSGLAENWYEGETLHVPQLTLRNLLSEQVDKEDEIALLKIDVEGYEPDVLRGAPELFSNRRVRAAILEVTTTLPVDWVGDLLESTSANYDAYAIEEAGRIKKRLALRAIDAETAMAESIQWNLLLRRR